MDFVNSMVTKIHRCEVCNATVNRRADSVMVTRIVCSAECNAKRKAAIPKRVTMTSTQYWINRGMSREDAVLHVKKIQRERSPRRLEYWIKRGHSIESATEQVSLWQKRNAKIGHDKYTKEDRRRWSSFCPDYWIDRGFTEEEAKALVSRKSSVVSLEGFIHRYGPTDGPIKYEAFRKQSAYRNSLEGYIAKHGEEKGTEMWLRKFKTRKNSKSATKFFKKVLENLNIPDKIYTAANSNGEYGVRDLANDRYYFYDFVIPALNLAIEYYGDYWHCREDLYEDSYYNPRVGKTAKEIRDYDADKKNCIETTRGFNLLVVWESEATSTKIQEISNYINSLSCTINSQTV